MKILKHTNQSKKLILVIVCIMLFSFCCPKQVQANDVIERVEYAVVDLLYMVEKGILTLANNIFCDDSHDYKKGNEDTEIISLSPDSIIKGKFLLMDANIFKNITDTSEYLDGGNISGSSILTGRNALRDVISGWYYALRNLAIVALLSILTYVGIRMLMTSVSQDKAKYKTMLKDWIIALCLLFAMHYIMIASLNICSTIVDAIGTTGKNANTTQDTMNKINTNLNSAWTKIEGATSQTDKEEFSENIGDAFGQIVVLGGIIGYTVIFAFKYLKRMITIVFLILLAPITCITYPIDKIADGKAQAYNRWFQEFLYNVIIQPFHLLIYIVLVGSATELADTNVLYAIMCFAIMIPAEKLIREMFGFKDKLGSPLGAFASGALFSKLAGKGSGGSSGSNANTSNKEEDMPIPTKNVELPGKGKNPEDGGENPELSERENPEDGGVNPELGEGENPEDGGENPELGEGENPEDGGENPELGEGENPELSERENPEDGGTNPNEQTEKEKPGRLAMAHENAKSRRARNRMKKYGNNKFGGGIKQIANRTGKKLYSGAKNAGRKTIRGATSLAGAGLGYLTGAMFGQGKAGAAAGAALGSRMGKGITNVTDKAWNNFEEWGHASEDGFIDAGRGENELTRAEERDKKDFIKNEKNIKLARQNYLSRHPDKKNVTGEELMEELNNMYDMKRHGIHENEFNDTLANYEKNKKNGEDDASALGLAELGTIDSRERKKDFFEDPKKVENAYAKKVEDFKNAGYSQEKAENFASGILKNSASMKGTSVKLPQAKQKITIPTANNMYGKLKFTNDKNGQVEQEQVQAIQDVLVEIGFDDNKIKQVIEYSSGNTNEEIITSFAQNVKYIVSNDINENNNIKVEEIKSGQFKQHIVKNETVIKENLEKLDLSKKTGITDKTQLEKMRQLEIKEGTTEFREEGGKMIRGEYSKNDKNNLSERTLEMAEKYKRATSTPNPNTKKKKK